ncbi:MAG: winged helix-turn-helix domain-containing protein [Candidatus Nezhaarchaeota archaeon]|nr:winged helix-turn-helix domain-containing protein [Candidatus Nezhaarchaeota archaeon]
MAEARQRLIKQALGSLSDETRFKLVKSLVAEGPASAGELASKLGKARSTIDEHIEELLGLGLISRRRVDRRFIYEATELAKACLRILEGEPLEKLLEGLPERARVEVKVVEAPRAGLLRALSNPALTTSVAVVLALILRPLAAWIDLRGLLALIGLCYGVADARGVVRVERRGLAGACVAAAFITAVAASIAMAGRGVVEAFVVGFLLYLAWYALCAFIPFEAVRLLWRR